MRVEDWAKASFALWMLSFEMATVVTLRCLMVAGGGGAADAEMRRMVSEKISAALQLQALALRGGLGSSLPAAIDRSARHYHRRVRANRRRLVGQQLRAKLT